MSGCLFGQLYFVCYLYNSLMRVGLFGGGAWKGMIWTVGRCVRCIHRMERALSPAEPFAK